MHFLLYIQMKSIQIKPLRVNINDLNFEQFVFEKNYANAPYCNIINFNFDLITIISVFFYLIIEYS